MKTKMDHSRKFIRYLIASLLVISLGAALFPALPVTAEEPWPPVKPETAAKVDYSEGRPGISAARTATTDSFGYVMNAATYNWIEINAPESAVDFPCPDDCYSSPIEFNFKFYENSYSELYVSTNGLITFGRGDDEFVNQPIPNDMEPDNLIAPFWDDLSLPPGSQVSAKTFNAPSGKYLVLEWYQVTRMGYSDQLTFEAILYENGNIVLQYKQLNGVLDQATVGIEDSDGVDGLLYVYNASGLSSSQAIQFTRPSADWRVKLTPNLVSGFTKNRTAYLYLELVNTGDKGAESYNLAVNSLPPGWSVNIYRSDTWTALFDTNGDSLIETGSIPQGGRLKLALKVRAPTTADTGASVQFNLTAISSNAPSRMASSTIQAAIPAPFAQAVFDNFAGMSLQLSWTQKQITTRFPISQFTGSNLLVVSVADNGYFYAREYNNSVGNTNLEYAIINQFGSTVKPISPLTNNTDTTHVIVDRSLYLAGLPNGRVGAVWVRTLINKANGKMIDNIYISILSFDGKTVLNPTKVTNNSTWNEQGSYALNSPRIIGSGEYRFILAWNEFQKTASQETSDLITAIFDQNGSSKLPPTRLTDSQGSGFQYGATAPVGLSNSNVLLATVVTDGDSLSTTKYRIINPNGGIVLPETSIPGSAGSVPDGVQIGNGAVLLAWNVPQTEQLQYVTLSGADFTSLTGPRTLSTPKNRLAGVVSVTRDEDGHGILTWSEAEQFEYLSYALVNSSGDVLTEPVIFCTGQGDEPKIDTNTYGVGNAYSGDYWQSYLPITLR